jgi:hypothetical protein
MELDRPISDWTLLAADVAMEAASAKEPVRRYIGASIAGNQCDLFLWYTLYGPAVPRSISARGLKAIQDGHTTEEVMAARLARVPGVEIYDRQGGFSDLGGLFKGHWDGRIRGILEAPITEHIWENKACNAEKYEKLRSLRDLLGEKQALQKWDYVYYIQAILYMHYSGTKRHYLTVCLPGARDAISVRTNANPELAKATIWRIGMIIESKAPPVAMKAPACNWCMYKSRCSVWK